MECVPTASVELVKVAVALATPKGVKVPVPSVVAPSLNVTGPTGVPAVPGEAVTVAVNVTDWPAHVAACDELRVVVVVATAATMTVPGVLLGSEMSEAVTVHGPPVF